MTKTFQVGKTYSTRSACDYDCVFSWTVISRTAKRMVLEDRHGHQKTVGIGRYYTGDMESAKPQGTFSMCPVITPEDEAA